MSKKLKPKQIQAIRMILDGEPYQIIAYRVGVCPETLSRWVHCNPAFSEELTRLLKIGEEQWLKRNQHEAEQRRKKLLLLEARALCALSDALEEDGSSKVRAAQIVLKMAALGELKIPETLPVAITEVPQNALPPISPIPPPPEEMREILGKSSTAPETPG